MLLLLLLFLELIECNLQPLTSCKTMLSAVFPVVSGGHVLPPDQSKACFEANTGSCSGSSLV